MLRQSWNDAIHYGFADASVHFHYLVEKEREARIQLFAQRWGAVDVDAFQRALQEGDESERLWALFALGWYLPAEVADLLAPFLSSPFRKERWASAIGLGQHKDERAFVVLQYLLLDELAYHLPHAEEPLYKIWTKASEEAQIRFGNPTQWDLLVSPEIVTAFQAQTVYQDDYLWYMHMRRRIIELFRLWNDPRVVPALSQTFQVYWDMENLSPDQGGVPLYCTEDWYETEDALASTLGHFQAWHALDTIEMPPARFKLARMCLVLGSFQVKLHLLAGVGDLSIPLQMADVDRSEVIAVLQQHYGLDRYLAEASLDVFRQWYQQRKNTQ